MPTWKNTKQREAILQVLAGAQTPLSAEEVCCQVSKQYPRLALSTVYRNLERLPMPGFWNAACFMTALPVIAWPMGIMGIIWYALAVMPSSVSETARWKM